MRPMACTSWALNIHATWKTITTQLHTGHLVPEKDRRKKNVTKFYWPFFENCGKMQVFKTLVVLSSKIVGCSRFDSAVFGWVFDASKPMTDVLRIRGGDLAGCRIPRMFGPGLHVKFQETQLPKRLQSMVSTIIKQV